MISMRPLIFTFFSMIVLSGCETVSRTVDDIDWPKIPKLDWTASKTKTSPTPQAEATLQQSSCPAVVIIPELSLLTQFAGGQSHSANSEQVRTRFDRASAQCRNSTSMVEVVLSLNFTSALGPAGIKDSKVQANYVAPYFVSVVSETGEIISKDVFALSLVFPKGQTNIMATETLRQTIPLSSTLSPATYRIMIGFQLDGNDLLYNRSMNLPPVNVDVQDVSPAPTLKTPAPQASEGTKPLSTKSQTPKTSERRVND